jgi:hypothetical protein
VEQPRSGTVSRTVTLLLGGFGVALAAVLGALAFVRYTAGIDPKGRAPLREAVLLIYRIVVSRAVKLRLLPSDANKKGARFAPHLIWIETLE